MTKDGQYYYTPHRSSWAVYRAGKTNNGSRIDTFIRDFDTKEEASREVYRLNGWKPKSVT